VKTQWSQKDANPTNPFSKFLEQAEPDGRSSLTATMPTDRIASLDILDYNVQVSSATTICLFEDDRITNFDVILI
jgi:hypothetical protein